MADLTGPVDVFAWALHGHLIMTRGRLEHYRAGEFLGVLGCFLGKRQGGCMKHNAFVASQMTK